MNIKSSPTSLRINKELLNRIKRDAEKEKRSITKQIEYMIEAYYKMKDLTNDQ